MMRLANTLMKTRTKRTCSHCAAVPSTWTRAAVTAFCPLWIAITVGAAQICQWTTRPEVYEVSLSAGSLSDLVEALGGRDTNELTQRDDSKDRDGRCRMVTRCALKSSLMNSITATYLSSIRTQIGRFASQRVQREIFFRVSSEAPRRFLQVFSAPNSRCSLGSRRNFPHHLPLKR